MHSFSFLLLSAVFWRSLSLFSFLYSISSTFSSSSSSPSFPFSILSLFLSFAYLLFLLLLTDRILVFSPSSSSSSSSSSLPRATVGSQCILITENYDLWVRMGRGGALVLYLEPSSCFYTQVLLFLNLNYAFNNTKYTPVRDEICNLE